VVFWIAEEEYAVQIEGLSDRLIGRGEAELRVVRRWSPGKRVQAEIQRVLLQDGAARLVQGDRGDRAGACGAEEHISDVLAMIDGARLLEARCALGAGHRGQARTREKLRWLRWQPRLWVGRKAPHLRRTTDERSDPGSRGWLEVTLNDIGGGTAQMACGQWQARR